jgi:hypothetical protein
VEHCRGSVARPLSDKELEEKLLMQAENVISNATAKGIIDLCWNIETVNDVGAEMRTLFP